MIDMPFLKCRIVTREIKPGEMIQHNHIIRNNSKAYSYDHDPEHEKKWAEVRAICEVFGINPLLVVGFQHNPMAGLEIAYVELPVNTQLVHDDWVNSHAALEKSMEALLDAMDIYRGAPEQGSIREKSRELCNRAKNTPRLDWERRR